MGDPRSRDRHTAEAGKSEPDVTSAGPGPGRHPGTLERTLASEIDPGQATGSVTRALATSPEATGPWDATPADGPQSSPADRPAPTIAGYEIEGELGRGAMGVVYLARQVRLNRPCALKVILAGAHADPVAAVRFLGEAEAVAKLQHPGIVQIHHIGEADGLPFLELEYVPGGSLDRALDGTPWPARRATTLVEALARAAAEAHRLGIIHRDLKPGKILIAADGTPKIADFGLAKSLSAESGLTATESIMGSPSYMAPEQAEGKTKQVGPLADVYALGVILYELLVGRPPFRGATVLETLAQVKSAEPVPPSRLVPGLPRDLETFALKCLQKDPAKRYDSADALAEDLRRFLEDRPIQARRPGPVERLARWGRRNRGQAAALAAIASLVLTVVVGSNIAAWRFRAQREELRLRDYVSRVERANLEIIDDNMALAEELLDGCPTDLRGLEWRIVKRLGHLDVSPKFVDVRQSVTSLAYSPDGRWLFAAEADMYSVDPSSQAELVKRDAATGQVIHRLPVPGSIRSIAVSPDGKVIALGIGAMDGESGTPRGSVLFCDAQDLKISGRHDVPGPWWANGVAFGPDGSKILVGYADNDSGTTGGAQVLDRSGKEIPAVAISVPDSQGVTSVAFHPDGRRVALGSFEGLAIDELEDEGPPVPLESRQRGWLYALAFSRDGRYLASAGWGSTIHSWNMATMRLIQRLDGHRGFVRDLEFSPDGRHLASVGEDRSVRLWHLETGHPVAAFHGHAQYTYSVAWHPEGRLLASGGGDNAIKLWDVEKSRTIVKWHFYFPTGLAFDPSSGHGAIASQSSLEASNGQYRLWDPTTGESRNHVDLALDPASAPSFLEATRAQRGKLFERGHFYSALAFSPDGRLVAFPSGPDVIEVRGKKRGELIQTLGPEDKLWTLAFTPDGAHLVAGGRSGTITLWHLGTGRKEWKVSQRRESGPGGLSFVSVAVSPDGRQVATSSDAAPLVLRDVTTGEIIATLEDDPRLRYGSCAFNKEGTLLAVGCSSQEWRFGLVKVFDVGTGQKLYELHGRTGPMFDVAFSPDGQQIASASGDRTIKLWDTARRKEVLTLRGHTQGVFRVAFSPDGNLLASSSFDWTVRIWDARPLP
jgi:WD40 repeat protein